MAVIKPQIVIVLLAALAALYFYPARNELREDLLVALNSSLLNESDVIRGLAASGVKSRHDLVRLKKEVAWWFLENEPGRLDAITKFTISTKDSLAFEGWLVSKGVPMDLCLKLLHSHGIRSSSDFSAANGKRWRSVFVEINAQSPCNAILDLVRTESPHVFQEKSLKDFEAGGQWQFSIFSVLVFFVSWFWSLAGFLLFYASICAIWGIVVFIVAVGMKKSRRRSAMELAKFTAQTLFIAFFPVILSWSLFSGLSQLVLRLLSRSGSSRSPNRPHHRSPSASEPSQVSRPVDHGPSLFSSSFYTGNYLDVSHSKIEWNGSDTECHEYAVGSTVTFEVKAHCRNGSMFALKSVDDVTIALSVNQHSVPFSKAMPSQRLPSVTDTADSDDTVSTSQDTPAAAAAAAAAAGVQGNSVVVTFFSRRAGQHQLDVSINGKPMPRVFKIFAPGAPDASHSSLRSVRGCMAIAANAYRDLDVHLCDVYGNSCINVDQSKLKLEVSAVVEGDEDRDSDSCNYLVETKRNPGVFEILYNVAKPGMYTAKVSFDGQLLQDGAFSLISLTSSDLQKVQENVQNKRLNEWHEAKLYKPGSRKDTTVYIYLLPKQICIKEFYMYVIPHKLFAFRIRPSTKMVCCAPPGDPSSSAPCFAINDAWQGPVHLLCKDRNIVMATFAELLGRSLGGGESFEQKRVQFNTSLRQMHSEYTSQTCNITVRRSDLLESSKSALTHFKNGWKKKWRIEFDGEEGLDYGGVSREFYHVISSVLFDPSTGLFRRFNVDDSQGLVQPNPRRPVQLKVEYYKFAGRIVGRCLLESSRGHPMMIKAHFTRSFLAQIIGMRVNHTYFQTDDPELFTSKVQYTLKNDVTDLEMVFAEEEYLADNMVKVIPLEPGGENKAVTNENKVYYLDLLADYRLGKSIREEIEAFLKGLNEIVPDTLLCMFDENELELLMCGAGNIVFDDLKTHCKLTSRQVWFVDKVIPWFWVAVSSFTQDELAKLVQFTTGSSQLPPGGFAELRPEFQISPAPVHGSLPTSHTCFNQLCLPDYDSCEDLQRALGIAINEGSEGFALI